MSVDKDVWPIDSLMREKYLYFFKTLDAPFQVYTYRYREREKRVYVLTDSHCSRKAMATKCEFNFSVLARR